MKHDLAGLMDQICAVPLNDKLTDEALTALSRSYLSMQNLLVGNGPVAGYGRPEQFDAPLENLYRICLRRCQGTQPFIRRSRMLPLLYALTYQPMRGVDAHKSQTCWKLMVQLIEEWTQHPALHEDRGAVYGVLRCISDLYRYLPTEERERAAGFHWFRQCISAWAVSLNDEGGWDGVLTDEALDRIELMSRNANLFSDHSHDSLIDKARVYCSRSILRNLQRTDGIPLRSGGLTLFWLYEVMMWGIWPLHDDTIESIAERARKQAEASPCASDEWLLCQSVRLDYACMHTQEELMYDNRLQQSCDAVCAVPIDERLSDEDLLALAEIYLTLLDQALAKNAAEGLYQNALAQLFTMIRARGRGRKNLARRAAMTAASYTFFSQPDMPFDERDYADCLRRTFRLVEDWRHAEEGQKNTEYDILRCLIEAFRYVRPEDRIDDPRYRYLAERVAGWFSTMDAEGGWQGVSDCEAVNRLSVLAACEPFLSDSTADRAAGNPFAEKIRLAVNVYFERVRRSVSAAPDSAAGAALQKRPDGQTLYRLYRIVQYDLNLPDAEKAAQIARWAACGSGDLWHQALVIDYDCLQRNQRLKTRMLACSA